MANKLHGVIERTLRVRFHNVPQDIVDLVKNIQKEKKLDDLFEFAVTCKDLESFREKLLSTGRKGYRWSSMTEQEWQRFSNPLRGLHFIFKKGSDRKIRLFSVACGRRTLDLEHHSRGEEIIAAAEDFADGKQNCKELLSSQQAWAILGQDMTIAPLFMGALTARWNPYHAARKETFQITHSREMVDQAGIKEFEFLSNILRDIFGNPFRPVTVDPSWLTPTVTALTQTIYYERNFEAMPILGDALEEAGCSNNDMLEHCRGNGPHVRGCWVVDLFLGKE